MTTTDRQNAVQKLGELIRDIRIAMLTTQTSDGFLRSRPMETPEREFDGDLWFFAHASDPKIAELENQPQVNVSYAAPDKQEYISISGVASVVRDRRQAEALWEKRLEKWFQGGADDPDLALVRVEVEAAEYWDEQSGAMSAIAGFAKSIAGGGSDQAQHEKIGWGAE